MKLNFLTADRASLIMEKSKKEIPPGLIRIVKRNKPSKKFYFLLGISIFFVFSGLGVLYFYSNFFDSKPINIVQRKHNVTVPSDKLQDFEQKREAKETSDNAKGGVKKEEGFNKETEPHKNKEIAKTEKQITRHEKERDIPKESLLNVSESFKGVDFLYRAKDFEQRGLFLEAIDEYKKYINFTGIGDGRILNKIVALYVLMGNLKEAEHYSELAIRDAQNNREILINYGVIKAKLGELNKAEEIFTKVLAIEPDNKTVLFNMALVKEKKGEYREAINFYERLYKLGDKSVLQYIERLNLTR